MELGSLFDGSGGFPLAGVANGIRPVWSSEIEPYPLRVTARRLPNVKQLGDVTKINGAEIKPVDIITFGSPCQDLSVAGKQKGIHGGERSSLFFQAIRIAKEMRERDRAAGRADEHVRPRYLVWENVPGAFSSNNGEDFRAVLEALGGIAEDGVSIPRPAKGKWQHAGCVVGDGWSIAWRVYDAQYWGVPQRRKRIYLVADLASERAGEILFERESLCGDPAESGEARQGVADDAQGGAGRGCGNGVSAAGFKAGQSMAGGIGWQCECAATLAANSSGTELTVCYTLQGNGIDRALTAGCNGAGWREQVSYTLNTIDRHGVVFAAGFDDSLGKKAQGGMGYTEEGTPTLRAVDVRSVVYDCRGNGDDLHVPTLTGDHQNRVTDYTALCVGNGQLHQMSMAEQSNTLDCMHDQQAVLMQGEHPRKYIVRRLTPLECCRLQGFPDWWEDGVEGSDSARYKMWGNGIALPCAADVLGRIARAMAEQWAGKCTGTQEG